MNIVFMTGNEEYDKEFVASAREEGLINLAGYRTLGGMRASLYNAVPEEAVDMLIDFMERFKKSKQG